MELSADSLSIGRGSVTTSVEPTCDLGELRR